MKTPCRAGFPVRPILWSLLVIFMAWAALALSSATREDVPFYPRERLLFGLRWGLVSAGEAVMENLPVTVINGIPAYHFMLDVRSSPFLDVFFKVRNRIEGFADTRMTRSLLYKKDQKEGGSSRDIVVTFDWETNHATYSNFDQPEKPVPIRPGAFDPLSVLFYMRLLDLKVDSEFQRPITDGKKSILVTARVVRRETVTVPGGRFDTHVLETRLKDIGGDIEKPMDTQIRLWVTTDARRIPVRIESRLRVGSLLAELISADGLSGGSSP